MTPQGTVEAATRRTDVQGASHGEDRQVQVRFTTKLPQKLRVPTSTFAVPARLTRYGLSEVINALLGLDPPRPFDFVISTPVDGDKPVSQELLRDPLESLLLTRGLSAESVLSLEYIPAQAPPEVRLGSPHEDWVAALDASHKAFVISGSYDGVGHLWCVGGSSTDGLAGMARLTGHTDAITCVSRLSAGGHSPQEEVIALSSKDRSIRVYRVAADILRPTETPQNLHAYAVLQGHSAAVQGLAAGPRGEYLCSGGWDKTVRVWKLPEPDAELEADEPGESNAAKKRRVNGTDAGLPSARTNDALQGSPERTFEGHSQCVSAVAWPQQRVIWSASWDHSIRRWDAESGINVFSFHGAKALLTLSVLPSDGDSDSASLVAAGGADIAVSIWDPRASKTTMAAIVLSSHKGWITSVKWNPFNGHQLLSASHDSSVKLWDIRSKIPLFTMASHTDKVLCVDWWKAGKAFVSGGADCKLQLHDMGSTE